MFAFFYSIFGFLFRILYSFINNYGLALLIFTLFFRLIIMPTNIKQQKSSATQVRMQPKLKRIREKYQDYTPQERNQKIQEETNELYQREGYNAMAGSCMPLLFQLPILWGLYGVVREPLKYVLQIPTDLLTALTNVAKTSLNLSTRGLRFHRFRHRSRRSSRFCHAQKLRFRIDAGKDFTPHTSFVFPDEHDDERFDPAAPKEKQPQYGKRTDDGLHDADHAADVALVHVPVPRRYGYVLDPFQPVRVLPDLAARPHLRAEKNDRPHDG